MVIEESIKIKHYKCFDSEAAGFERIMPINIIIGKNNSGKSSLLELIRYTIDTNANFLTIGSNDTKTQVIIQHKLDLTEISSGFQSNISGGFTNEYHLEYGKRFIGSIYTYELLPGQIKKLLSLNSEYLQGAKANFENISARIKSPLFGKTFCHITAERDIAPEAINGDLSITPNGQGATHMIEKILNDASYDSNLIEKELLIELNKITNPEIEFSRILVQNNGNRTWEIFFDDRKGTRIALSKMGSGVKTIILVLLNLIVKPKIENKKVNDYIYCFEELENNLHPALQRRLYAYLIAFSKANSIYLFLTTHSNIVIDSFGTYENAQLIHITNDGVKSTTKTLLGIKDHKQILKDLDLRASDLLQSNGIIWVEGPSDRNYILKWLEILAPNLKEGFHFSIMFYGGRLLSNLTFDFEWLKKEIIPLLKINSNAFVIIDRDGKTASVKLNETKKRIETEIGSNNCWITKGREIENYLSESVIKTWLNNYTKETTYFVNNSNKKLEDNIDLNKKVKLKYNLNKNSYSSEISQYITKESINISDLKLKLEGLIKEIKNWNNL